MKSKFIENVYDSLTGVLNRPMDGIENAFESVSLCEKSYSQVYEAYSRLMERLSVDSEVRMWKLLSIQCLQFKESFASRCTNTAISWAFPKPMNKLC